MNPPFSLLNLGPKSVSRMESYGGLFNLPDSYQLEIDRIIDPDELMTTSAAHFGAKRIAGIYDEYVRNSGRPEGVAIMTPPIFNAPLEILLRERGADIYYPEYRRINGEDVFLGFVEAPNPFLK